MQHCNKTTLLLEHCLTLGHYHPPNLKVCLECISSIIRIFVTAAKTSPAMAGPAGLGATALLHHLCTVSMYIYLTSNVCVCVFVCTECHPQSREVSKDCSTCKSWCVQIIRQCSASICNRRRRSESLYAHVCTLVPCCTLTGSDVSLACTCVGSSLVCILCIIEWNCDVMYVTSNVIEGYC